MTTTPKIGLSDDDSAWPNVRWEHAVDIEARPIRVLNEIVGDGPEADYLRGLLDTGHLMWTAEVRCPSTAFSFADFSNLSEITVDLSRFEHLALNRDRFLICGLAAARSFELNTQGSLPIFDPMIEVVQGSWMSSHQLVYEISHPIRSLLIWKARQELDEGQLSVRPVSSLRYEALVHPDLYREIVNLRCRPDIWVAALIAALADLHGDALKSQLEIEDDADAQPSEALSYFKRHDIPLGDLFNAAEAATKLVPLDLTMISIEDVEDDLL